MSFLGRLPQQFQISGLASNILDCRDDTAADKLRTPLVAFVSSEISINPSLQHVTTEVMHKKVFLDVIAYLVRQLCNSSDYGIDFLIHLRRNVRVSLHYACREKRVGTNLVRCPCEFHYTILTHFQ
jgi:hypothetical protein